MILFPGVDGDAAGHATPHTVEFEIFFPHVPTSDMGLQAPRPILLGPGAVGGRARGTALGRAAQAPRWACGEGFGKKTSPPIGDRGAPLGQGAVLDF